MLAPYIQPEELPTYAPMVTIDESEKAGLCRLATNIAIGSLGWDLLQQDYTEIVQVNPRNECKLTYKNVTEIKSAQGRYPMESAYLFEPILFLDRPQWETLDVPMNYFNSSTGILWLPPGTFGVAFDQAMVTYTAGYPEVPESVKQACGMIAAALWQRKDYAGINDMRDFDSEVSYFKQTIVSDEAMDMLKGYRIVGYA